jgi:protein-tyrosine phosphatase
VRTELHFHLLPGVDDGPADEAEAVALARLAVADGTGTVVATPHVSKVRIGELPERVEQLQSVLTDAGVELAVRQGGELSPDDVFAIKPRELDAIAQGPPGKRWVLLEAPLLFPSASLSDAAAEVRARGFDVLIGHPERSASVSLDELHDHVAAGSIIQINASSLMGGHGARAEHKAVELARSGLPFVLASDAHTPSRPPLLTEAASALAAAGIEAEVIHEVAETGPARLLREGLPAVELDTRRERRRLSARFRRLSGRAGRGQRRAPALSD